MPDYWDGLLEAATSPVWPRIVTSEVWNKDLLPWLKRLLAQTAWELMRERDEQKKIALQIRGLLLEGLIREPDVQIGKLRALADNEYDSGRSTPVGANSNGRA